MDKAGVGTGVALHEQVAEEARVIAWLVEATNDFESLGAEAAAEFGL